MLEEEFNHLIEEFASNQILKEEGWRLIQKGEKKFLNINFYKKMELKFNKCEENEEKIEDEDYSIQNLDYIHLKYDIHIVYSCSYQVPVLYFNIYKDENLLQHNKILTISEIIPDNKYTFITQGAHPILGTMFYYLHPCQTLEFMKNFENNKDYLLNWLSTYGSMIGYYLKKELFIKN